MQAAHRSEHIWTSWQQAHSSISEDKTSIAKDCIRLRTKVRMARYKFSQNSCCLSFKHTATMTYSPNQPTAGTVSRLRELVNEGEPIIFVSFAITMCNKKKVSAPHRAICVAVLLKVNATCAWFLSPSVANGIVSNYSTPRIRFSSVSIKGRVMRCVRLNLSRGSALTS